MRQPPSCVIKPLHPVCWVVWRWWLCVAPRWQEMDGAYSRVYVKGHQATSEHPLILNPWTEVYVSLFLDFSSQNVLFDTPKDRKTQDHEHFNIYSYLKEYSNNSFKLLQQEFTLSILRELQFTPNCSPPTPTTSQALWFGARGTASF